MAETDSSHELFITVENALKGDFLMVKKKDCQPPEGVLEEAWMQQTVTEDQANTSAFGTDSGESDDIDRYDTAPLVYESCDDSFRDCKSTDNISTEMADLSSDEELLGTSIKDKQNDDNFKNPQKLGKFKTSKECSLK